MQDTPRSAEPSPITRALQGLCFAWVAVLSCVRFVPVTFSHLNWSDRDLYRASALWTDWPTTGAEMNYGVGAQVPGGFYYWLIGAPLALRSDPVDVFTLLIAMDVGATAVLTGLAWRFHGRTAAAVTAAASMLYCTARRPMLWLWNPTALPLFLALGLAGIYGMFTRAHPRRWVVLWAGALALGAHAHMTAAAWLAVTAASVAILRPRDALRWIPLGFVTAALTYVPYAISEVMRGYPNTEAMLRQRLSGSEAQSGGLYFSLDEFLLGASYLVPQVPEAPADLVTLTQVLGGCFACLALIGGLTTFRPGSTPAWRAARVAALGVLASLLLPAVGASIHVEWRYLLAATPAFALLTGLGAGTLTDRWPRTAPVVLGVVLLLTSVHGGVVLSERWRVWTAEPAAGLYEHHARRRLYQALETRTGLQGAALVGRLGLAKRHKDKWLLGEPLPEDFSLRQRGEVFPGSLPPPCHLVRAVPLDATPTLTSEQLADIIGGDPASLRVLSSERLMPGFTWSIYDPGTMHCPTNLTNRYLDTAVEAALRRQVWERVPPGEVVSLHAEGLHRWAVTLEGPEVRSGARTRVLVAVDMATSNGHVDITLHSNQLRGIAYNGGWYALELIHEPRLHLTQGDQQRVLPIHDGFVGASYVATPLHVRQPMPSGTWQVSLAMDVHPHHQRSDEWPWAPRPPREVEVDLGMITVP